MSLRETACPGEGDGDVAGAVRAGPGVDVQIDDVGVGSVSVLVGDGLRLEEGRVAAHPGDGLLLEEGRVAAHPGDGLRIDAEGRLAAHVASGIEFDAGGGMRVQPTDAGRGLRREGGALHARPGEGLRFDATDALRAHGSDLAGHGLAAADLESGLPLRVDSTAVAGAGLRSSADSTRLEVDAAALAGGGLEAGVDGATLHLRTGPGVIVDPADNRIKVDNNLGSLALGKIAHLASHTHDIPSAAGAALAVGGSSGDAADALLRAEFRGATSFPVEEAEAPGDARASATLPATALGVTGVHTVHCVSLPSIPFALLFGDPNNVVRGTWSQGVDEDGNMVFLCFNGTRWVRQSCTAPNLG